MNILKKETNHSIALRALIGTIVSNDIKIDALVHITSAPEKSIKSSVI